jgi:trimethylamine--corrinoid protein Co-methyltransferase
MCPMVDRMQVFTRDEIRLVHAASMEILTETGIRFNAQEAVDLFRDHGFRVDGARVFITEDAVMTALEKAPSRFTVRARNPVHDVAIGGDDFVFLPTGGAPNIVSVSGERKPATLLDYHNCCKLVQTSDQLDMNGLIMVQPTDIPPHVAHLEMLLANMVMCDKAYVGAAMSRQAAVDCLEMAAIAWGGEKNLMQQPVMATNVNAASPLKYSSEEAQSIIYMARLRQALIVTTLVMSGSSGPISLPGTLALANSEILAGIVLAQLAGPGTPVIYGSVSAPADMRTIVSAVGAPEAVALASAAIQLAGFYNLPCRTGGMLTNAHCPDAQAAAEGTLMMSTAVRNGANLILHACGQLGSYISMSFEKWLIDEEVCRMLRRLLCAMEINVESIDVATIKSVGSDGNYLTHPTTFKHCREMYQPRLFTRNDYQRWLTGGAMSAEELATVLLPERIDGYAKPPIDEGLEQALREFVDRRKQIMCPL